LFEDWINGDVKSVLLVEPNFPIPSKSRNHKNFLPIGLLKIASLLRNKYIDVELVRHGFDDFDKDDVCLDDFKESNMKNPDLICITSIFTYWANHVKSAVSYYKYLFPDTPILVGGIYASLMPNHCKEYTGCDDVIVGQIYEAEKLIPAYDLVDVGYMSKEISVFMLYNHELTYDELESKRALCFEWGVQITDCRFRPLDDIRNGYNPAKRNGQSGEEYFIHPNWTDKGIRKFRRNVRRHNICVRHDVDYHSYLMERKKIPRDVAKKYRKQSYDEIDKKIIPDAWTPKVVHDINEQDFFKIKTN
jgi:hypothetical protein